MIEVFSGDSRMLIMIQGSNVDIKKEKEKENEADSSS